MGFLLRRRGRRLWPALCLAPAVVAFLLTRSPSAAPLSELPTAAITAPAAGATVPSRTAPAWQGSDGDGSIVRFEYAVDPPAGFTPEEIATPESAPGVVITVILGPEANRDTLRVSKPAGGGTVSFDYVQTPMTSEAMLFMTPNADSVLEGSIKVPLESYSGAHTLLVRAMDDQGAYSLPASVDFLARTQTPVTWITRPSATQSVLEVGRSLRIEWAGTDPDGPEGPGTAPAGYRYKLVDLSALVPPIPVSVADPDYVVFVADQEPWISVPAESTGVTLTLPATYYVFAVRAVDEAGAVDPNVVYSRSIYPGNALRFQSLPGAGLPELLLDNDVFGPLRFETDGATHDARIGQNTDLRFTVGCYASAYGGQGDAMRWGLNLSEPEDEAGWSAWTPVGYLPSISFSAIGRESLHVQVRDTYGQTVRGRLDLDVVPMTFDRPVMWVDDVRDATFPRDTEHDAFWRSRFSGYPGLPSGAVDEFHPWGANDVEFLPPHLPSLEELGRHRVIVWDCGGAGYNGVSALLETAANGTDLRAYLRAGGRMWISGTFTVAVLNGPTPTGLADFNYPHEVAPGSFAFDFLNMYSGRVSNDKNATNARHGLLAVEAFPGSPAEFPGMLIDDNKLTPVLRGKYGIGGVDAVFDPILQSVNPLLPGKIDSLYVMRARYPFLGLGASVYDRRLVGYRWHDPAVKPVQGRFVWFGFPMHFFRDADAQQTFNRVMDWLLGEEPVPVDLLRATAERGDEGAEIRWEVADAGRLLGFHVFRETSGGARVRLTEALLTGGPAFSWRDPAPPSDAAEYWLQEVDRSGGSSWHGPIPLAAAPAPVVSLSPIRPNPFAASASIRFSLARRASIRLCVLDVRGREVAVLLDETRDAGAHVVGWDGRLGPGTPAAAGVYFFRLSTPEAIRVQKALLLR